MNDLNKNRLDELKSRNPGVFQDVPPGYFDQLPDAIMEKVQGKAHPKGNRISGYYIIGIAATLLLLLGLTFVFLNQKSNENAAIQLTENQMPVTVLIDSADNPESTMENAEVLPQVTLKESDPLPTDDPLEDLEEIPLEALLDYLNEIDEFGF
mgnify:CR=1 FL=1